MILRIGIVFLLGITLAGCGGSTASDVAGDVALCQQNSTNARIGCELSRNYLWYQELRNVAPNSTSSPQAYLAASLAPRDNFSFILTEQEYQDRFINAVFFGFGFATQRVDNASALQVLYVFDNGSAAQQGLRRGDKITAIEGRSVAEWLQGLDEGRFTNDDIYGPNQAGIVRRFEWQRPDNSSLSRDLVKNQVTTNTVMHRSVATVGDRRVGYLVFHTFIELSETELEQAFQYFQQQQIDELVLDLRYNGGGLIRVANQLSAHIAFPKLDGKVFLKYQYNDKNTNRNSTVFFAPGAGRTLLNLPRVMVLTTPGSCSSSELVINSLSPFIDVVQIGQPTCGKPVGQLPTLIDNWRLFAINFQTVNALDFGDYFAGLSPACAVTPNVAGDWGVPEDALYRAALDFIATGQCPAVSFDIAEDATSGFESPPFGDARNQPGWLLYNEQ